MVIISFTLTIFSPPNRQTLTSRYYKYDERVQVHFSADAGGYHEAKAQPDFLKGNIADEVASERSAAAAAFAGAISGISVGHRSTKVRWRLIL